MKNENGNVLFLILIAVVLFAALSYAVTQSSRSGGSDITEESINLGLDEVLNYVTSIRMAVTRMNLTGCDIDGDITFERAPFDGSDTDYTNPNNPQACLDRW